MQEELKKKAPLILILGYGLTGKAVASYLVKQNIKFVVYDEELLKKTEYYKKFCQPLETSVSLKFIENNLEKLTYAVVSPGFNAGHPVVSLLEESGITLKTDIELLLSYLQILESGIRVAKPALYDRDNIDHQKIHHSTQVSKHKIDSDSIQHKKIYKIAVTGTNGKSTVVTWLVEFLSSIGQWVAAGNIGNVLLDNLNSLYDLEGLVIELSSAQLHYIKNLELDIALCLDVDIDHVDWHGSESSYRRAKYKILNFGYPILNISNFYSIVEWQDCVSGSNNDEYYKDASNRDARYLVDKILINKDYLTYGAAYNSSPDGITFNDNSRKLDLAAVKYFKPTMHVAYDAEHIIFPDGRKLPYDQDYYWRDVDRENLAAVISVLYQLEKIWRFELLSSIPNFKKLRYRAEILRVRQHILINDSKATNVHAMLHTLTAVKKAYPGLPLIVLQGGLYKEDFIVPSLAAGDEYIVFGDAINLLDDTEIRVRIFRSFEQALYYVKSFLEEQEPLGKSYVVVFAPGGASLDEFTSYVQRGQIFEQWAKTL